MLKAAFGLVGTALVSLVFSFSSQSGCKDLRSSTTHLPYYDKPDMRTTVVLDPARGFLRDADTTAIPTTGVERPPAGGMVAAEARAAVAARSVTARSPDDS